MASQLRENAVRRIVTANRLTDGVVVYLTVAGGWSEHAIDGAVAEDSAAAEALLAAAEAASMTDGVVAPYLVDVATAPGALAVRGLREAIRAAGPTVRLDLGKQATDPPAVT